MIKAEFAPYTLHFREPATTSRQTMTEKQTYFVRVCDTERPDRTGVGECALFRGLSAEDGPDYEALLSDACRLAASGRVSDLPRVSSILFGFETAFDQYRAEQSPTPWEAGAEGIPINGLVWMGDKPTMRRRIREKLDAGFRCIKLKIGGIDFASELDLLREVRREFGPSDLELRVDANGSFTPHNALGRLDLLGQLSLHSIEQPLVPRRELWEDMRRLCELSPVPVALDEQLIGCHDTPYKRSVLSAISPAYVIIKPSLCGGFAQADDWIRWAEAEQIGWWATSALESDVGLCAIARWLTRRGRPSMPQGLGTGQLYMDNVSPSPLSVEGARLWHHPDRPLSLDSLKLQWRQ